MQGKALHFGAPFAFYIGIKGQSKSFFVNYTITLLSGAKD
jgi:hypothetical protein